MNKSKNNEKFHTLLKILEKYKAPAEVFTET